SLLRHPERERGIWWRGRRAARRASSLAHARDDELSDLRIAEAILLPAAQSRSGRIIARRPDFALHPHDLPNLPQEPWIDRGKLLDLIHIHSDAERVADGEDPLGAGRAQQLDDVIAVVAARLQSGHADLERAQSFLQCFVERAADGHGLADRLHGEAEKR